MFHTRRKVEIFSFKHRERERERESSRIKLFIR